MTSSATRRTIEAIAEGETFTFQKPEITTRQLVMYAGASGDFNRIHYDHQFAVDSGLRGVIGHGMLTMGMLAQSVTDWAGPGAMVRDIRSRFVTPVKPGDVVSFLGRVTSKDIRILECHLDIEGTVGGEAVIRGSAVVSWLND